MFCTMQGNQNMKEFEVLLVDDDPITHLMNRHILESIDQDITTKTFDDGQEFLDYLNENHDSSKCFFVLLDLNMPVKNGRAVLQEIQYMDIAFDLYVVILSSSLLGEDKKLVHEFPFLIDFLEKPMRKEDIKGLIEEHIIPCFSNH